MSAEAFHVIGAFAAFGLLSVAFLRLASRGDRDGSSPLIITPNKMDKWRMVLGDTYLYIRGGEWCPPVYDAICARIQSYIEGADNPKAGMYYERVCFVGGPHIEIRESKLEEARGHSWGWYELNPVFALKRRFPARVNIYIADSRSDDHFAFGYPSLLLAVQEPSNGGVSVTFWQRNDAKYSEYQRRFKGIIRDLEHRRRKWTHSVDHPDREQLDSLVGAYDSYERGVIYDHFYSPSMGSFDLSQTRMASFTEKLKTPDDSQLETGMVVCLSNMMREYDICPPRDAQGNLLQSLVSILQQVPLRVQAGREEFVRLDFKMAQLH